ncbi:hypothetical protein OK016_00565 [Vibrio chagasii]|nr:hypothetical protein [Vibrio chagasii]
MMRVLQHLFEYPAALFRGICAQRRLAEKGELISLLLLQRLTQSQSAKKQVKSRWHWLKKQKNGARTQQIQAAKSMLKAKAAADLMGCSYQRVNNLYNRWRRCRTKT